MPCYINSFMRLCNDHSDKMDIISEKKKKKKKKKKKQSSCNRYRESNKFRISISSKPAAALNPNFQDSS